jgi:hypothetical protein
MAHDDTATGRTIGRMMDRRDAEFRERVLDTTIQSFTKSFRPSDLRDADDFDRALHSLVRLIYREAQQPLLDGMTKIASASVIVRNVEPSPLFIEDEIATLQAAVENLRGGGAKSPEAAFRIAHKLETMAKRFERIRRAAAGEKP